MANGRFPRHYGGTVIYKNPCEECRFCDLPGKKENRFAVCLNPYVGFVTWETRGFVIHCPKRYKKCEYYKYMKKNLKDIALIKKYIEKFVDGGYVAIKVKHLNWLMKRMSVKNSLVYLLKVFGFYGYIRVYDKEHVPVNVILISNRNQL